MKKGLLLLLVAALLLSLAACGGTGQQPEISDSQSESVQPSDASEPTQDMQPENTDSDSEQEKFSVTSTPAEDTVESSAEPEITGQENQNSSEVDTEMKMNVEAGGSVFSATLEDNEAVAAFVEMMQEAPVVIQMSDYSGFEKVGSLGTSLPASNSQTTTHAGDIVLYNGNQIVIFYGSNSWSYTRLGHIDDLTGWEDALGSGDVTVTFSVQ